jgi:trans-2,3-dihydro-3-hydroxyanthranilate isomerase
MRQYQFVTVDVFTDRRFGGNQLAVLPKADGLSDGEMQAIAAEFNLSETAFVLPPQNPGYSARVRIFHRKGELPFAGHPNVGTGFVLAQMGYDRDNVLIFEEIAGLVEVRVRRDEEGTPSGATITAPQPLNVGPEIPARDVASCAGLTVDDIVLTRHAPTVISMGNPYVVAEVTQEALTRALPDVASFRRVVSDQPSFAGRLSLHLYRTRKDEIRARMFAPLAGTFEDAATGSANAPLGGLLLSLGNQSSAHYSIAQGVEMGRPSRLEVTAWRGPRGIMATVGGRCVEVMSGEILV